MLTRSASTVAAVANPTKTVLFVNRVFVESVLASIDRKERVEKESLKRRYSDVCRQTLQG